MQKTIIKTIAILICITFLSTGFSLASSVEEYEDSTKEKTTTSDANFGVNYVTLYRYGPDGSITPVTIDIKSVEGKDVEEIIADKCNQLLENDIEIQSYMKNSISLNDNNSNLTVNIGLLFVKSQGKGFHYKTKTDIIHTEGRLLCKILLPRRNLIFCNYKKDPNANTTITPLVKSMLDPNATKYIEGNHSVLIKDFVGYTTWCGHLSMSFFSQRAFCGFAKIVICKKLS